MVSLPVPAGLFFLLNLCQNYSGQNFKLGGKQLLIGNIVTRQEVVEFGFCQTVILLFVMYKRNFIFSRDNAVNVVRKPFDYRIVILKSGGELVPVRSLLTALDQLRRCQILRNINGPGNTGQTDGNNEDNKRGFVTQFH